MTKNKKQKNQEVVGVVTEILPDFLFRVKVDGEDKEIFAYLGGKMRIHRIRVLVGDKVSLVLDPYGDRSRITRRL